MPCNPFPSIVLLLTVAPTPAIPPAGASPAPFGVAQLQALNPHLEPADPRELPMKLHALLTSDDHFFRGTADVFYEYCAAHYADWSATPEHRTWLHGDVHIGNLGAYRTAAGPSLAVHFGVVDLDETVQGPFQLDLLRAATALRYLARDDNATAETRVSLAIERLVRTYIEARSGALDYPTFCARHPAVRGALHRAANARRGAYNHTYLADRPNAARFVRVRRAGNAVKDVLDAVDGDTREAVVRALWRYVGDTEPGRFRYRNLRELDRGVRDVARWTRLGSSGSQGLHKYLILLERPLVDDDEDLILQMKEEPRPAAIRGEYPGATTDEQRGREIVRGYAALLDPPKWLIGWTRMHVRDYLIKTKDPHGEELAPGDFAAGDDVPEAGAIVGAAVGFAHRCADSSTVPREPAVLVAQLIERSRDIKQHLDTCRRSLGQDVQAGPLLQQARAYCDAAQAGGVP